MTDEGDIPVLTHLQATDTAATRIALTFDTAKGPAHKVQIEARIVPLVLTALAVEYRAILAKEADSLLPQLYVVPAKGLHTATIEGGGVHLSIEIGPGILMPYYIPPDQLEKAGKALLKTARAARRARN